MNAATDQFCSNCGYSVTASNTNSAQTVVSAPSSGTWSGSPAGAPTASGRRITGALRQGELVDHRYRILEAVGKGGFGAVYKAQDERFQKRVVALKEMSDSQLSPSEKATAIQDFRQEANLLVPLSHINLPNVSDIFEEAGKAYLVMEFIQGETLEKVQEDANGPLDERRVLRWAIQLCDVLQYLHTQPQQIIFRDMKPSNVMVTQNDQIKLIDFGIARIFKSNSVKDTTSLGSRGYAPLEQYGRGQSDPRSDIYALGATLYDLLAFETPPDAVTRQLNPSSLQPLRQLNPRLSPATEAIVAQAMDMDPQRRFQSAAAMQQAIIDSGLVPITGSTSSMPLSQIPPRALPPQNNPRVTTPPAANVQSQQQAAGAIRGAPSGSAAAQTLQPQQATQKTTSRRGFMIGVAALAVAGAGGYAAYKVISPKNSPQSQATPPPGSNGTLALDFYCSTEKRDWMDAAAKAFNGGNIVLQGKTLQVNPIYGGSLELADKIVSGSIKPVAWSPASAVDVDRFRTVWAQKNPNQDIIGERKLLAQSPLVFAVWDDLAQSLLKKYKKIDWDTIASALQLPGGWRDLGGTNLTGQVNFAHTRPDTSNSGLLTLTLMAYAYHKNKRTLAVADIKDAGFLKYMQIFEDAVIAFGISSGTYIQTEIVQKGEASYNIIATYENLVLTSENVLKTAFPPRKLLPFYPSVNIVSDHPFIVLQGNGITTEQQNAAKRFRDFLLEKPQQQLLLRSGLRPVNPDVRYNDNVDGNLFLSPDLKSYITQSYSPVALPGAAVTQELLNQWLSRYNDSARASG